VNDVVGRLFLVAAAGASGVARDVTRVAAAGCICYLSNINILLY
jgi:hypothetical protein